MRLKILGLMSGSSLDGLDMALVEFEIDPDGVHRWKVLATSTAPLPDYWINTLPQLTSSTAHELLSAHGRFGNWLGQLSSKYLSDTGFQADYIASHGHTISHHPVDQFTFQLGHGAHVAESSGIPAITDFRSADIAAGGQGAPLAPVIEKYLLPDHPYYLNLGGIANLSVRREGNMTAWDICPANQLLNHVARRLGMVYDDKGQLASRGTVQYDLLKLLQSPLKLPVTTPLALDNTEVMQKWMPFLNKGSYSDEDILSTITEYIAESVSLQLSVTEIPKGASIYITGGGAHNDFLIQRLREVLIGKVAVILPSREMIDFKEAILIALCGALRIARLPNCFCSVTGATHDTINGMIYLARQ